MARSACRLYGLNEKELLCTSHADIFNRTERGLRTHRRRRATALAHGQTLDQLLSTVPDLLFPIYYANTDDSPPLALPWPLTPPQQAWRCSCPSRPIFRSLKTARQHCRRHSAARLEEGFAQQVKRAASKTALIWTGPNCYPETLWVTTEDGSLGEMRREIAALNAKRVALPESTPLLSLLHNQLGLNRAQLSVSPAPAALRLEEIQRLLTELESSLRKEFKTLSTSERAAVYNYSPAHATSLQGIYGLRIPEEKTRKRRVSACARLLSIQMASNEKPDRAACTAALTHFLRAERSEAEELLRLTIRSTVAGKPLEALRIGPTVQHLVQGMQYLLRLLVAAWPAGETKIELLRLLKKPLEDCQQSSFRLLYEFSRVCKATSLIEGQNGHPKFHVDWVNRQHLRITDNLVFDASWLRTLFNSMQSAIDRLVRDLLCGFQPVFPAVIYRPPTKVGGYTRQALPVDDKAVMAIRRALRGRVEATKVWRNTFNELSDLLQVAVHLGHPHPGRRRKASPG